MSEETRDEFARERLHVLQLQNLSLMNLLEKQVGHIEKLITRVTDLETALLNQPANDGL